MSTWTGPFDATGKWHGRGVLLLEDGGRAEGECVDGLMQGVWLRTRPDGTMLERQYVDGKPIRKKVDVASGGLLLLVSLAPGLVPPGSPAPNSQQPTGRCRFPTYHQEVSMPDAEQDNRRPQKRRHAPSRYTATAEGRSLL